MEQEAPGVGQEGLVVFWRGVEGGPGQEPVLHLKGGCLGFVPRVEATRDPHGGPAGGEQQAVVTGAVLGLAGDVPGVPDLDTLGALQDAL